jgi:hypothetical protein
VTAAIKSRGIEWFLADGSSKIKSKGILYLLESGVSKPAFRQVCKIIYRKQVNSSG